MDDNDICDFLEYNVEDIEWLRCINGQISILDLIDKSALLSYLEEKNEKYCEELGICTVCRTPLVEKVEYEEIWGSKQVSERYWCCPYGCI